MNIFNRHTKKYLKLPSEEIEYEFINDVDQLKIEEEQILYKEYKRNYEELCIVRVMNDYRLLRYIINQTDRMCIIAVQKDPNALQYVKNQTREICILALNSSLKKSMIFDDIFVHIKDEDLRKEIYQKNEFVINYHKGNNMYIRYILFKMFLWN